MSLISFLTNIWRISYLHIKSRYFTLIKLINFHHNQYFVRHGHYLQVILVNIDSSFNWSDDFDEFKYY